MKRRFFVSLGLALIGPQKAFPQRNQTIKLIVGFPPGSATDIVVRLFAAHLTSYLTWPVVVENRPGADGYVAGLSYKTSEERGSYMAAPAGVFISPLLRKKPGYEIQDFDLVAYLGDFESPILCIPGQRDSEKGRDLEKVKSLADLVDILKSLKQEGMYATGNLTGLLACEQFKAVGGFKAIRVPYRGEAEALTDLSQQRVHFMFAFPTAAEKFSSGGSVTLLASSANSGNPHFSLASIKDTTDFSRWEDIGSFVGLMSNSRQDKGLTKELSEAIQLLLRQKEFISKLRKVSFLSSKGERGEAVLARKTLLWQNIIESSQLVKE